MPGAGTGLMVVSSNGAATATKATSKALSKVTNVYEHFDFKENIRQGECHSVPPNSVLHTASNAGAKCCQGDSYAEAL